jgi:nucleotide-binding universal stress UspA family protein
MISIERILCPVDLSDCSRGALAHAVAVGRWYGARVTALYVLHMETPIETGAIGLGAGVHAPLTLASVPREAAERQLQAFVAASPGAAGVELAVTDSVSVRDAILKQAEELRADLIVLGSHGFTGLTRLVLGSTAEAVLRHTSVPVLIVPMGAAVLPATGTPFRRIVCAVDFEAESYLAVRHALNFAQESDAQLTFLHVLQLPPSRIVPGVESVINVEAERQTLTQKARKRLEALVPEPARAFCTVRAEVTEGKPSAEILRAATASEADLIIMGVRGRDAVDVALFGSQTRAVLHGAPCPVLTVRQD